MTTYIENNLKKIDVTINYNMKNSESQEKDCNVPIYTSNDFFNKCIHPNDNINSNNIKCHIVQNSHNGIKENVNNMDGNDHNNDNDSHNDHILFINKMDDDFVEQLSPRPISERWSPLGANYDDTNGELTELAEYRFHNATTQNDAIQFNTNTSKNWENIDSEGNINVNDLSGSEFLGSPTKTLDTNRLQLMEDEQELLTSSLMSLTSHFAHVQFRVRQIVEAPSNQRDDLLKDLEEFAFRGIPETTSTSSDLDENTTAIKFDQCRQNQCDLIDRLKRQLTDLEKVAYESGAPVLPQSILLEKQKIIIDELKNKLNLNVNEKDLPQLSQEDLKNHIDSAIGELIGPLKMKDQLVTQLKTQITDLERFIAFLQCDTDDPKHKTLTYIERLSADNEIAIAYNSYAVKKKKKSMAANCSSSSLTSEIDIKKLADCANGITTRQKPVTDILNKKDNNHEKANGHNVNGCNESLNSKAHSLLDKAGTLLQMFAVAQFGCKSNRFQKNTLKKTSRGNHWGDTRAQLEVDIQEVASLAATLQHDRDKLNTLQKLNGMKAKTKTLIMMTSGQGQRQEQRQGQPQPQGEPQGQLQGEPQEQRHGQVISSQSSTSTTPASSPSICRNINKIMNSEYSTGASSDSDGIDDFYRMGIFRNRIKNDYKNAQNSSDSITLLNVELTTAVRKNFSVTLQKLIQHGLCAEIETAVASNLIVPFMGCFQPSGLIESNSPTSSATLPSSSSSSPSSQPQPQSQPHSFHFVASKPSRLNNYRNDIIDSDEEQEQQATMGNERNKSNYSDIDDHQDQDDYFYSYDNDRRQMHAWELILEYYNLKNGNEYNETPARKLSQSFNLDIVGARAISNKQSLLSTIGTIIAIHSPYKRSYNALFKAFVSAALNSHKLTIWLNLIFSCTDLINVYYKSWSYVSNTGFRDAIRSIDCLTKYDFDLPVDLAVRQFQNIKDVFM